MYFDEQLPFLVSRPQTKDTSIFDEISSIKLLPGLALALFLLLISSNAGQCADSFALIPASKPGTRRIQATIEVAGDLKLNADGKKVTRAPLKVHGELNFEERVGKLDSVPSSITAVRAYERATAKIQIGDSSYDTTLSEDRRIIGVGKNEQETFLFSPLGPLTREQVDLLESPCGRITMDQLLPGKSVGLNETWSVSEAVLGRLLNLDTVSQSSITATLKEVTNHVAQVQCEGTVTGVVSGMTTEIELKAKYNFDCQGREVTWLGLAIRENRSVGHAEPGFETIAKIAMHVSSIADSTLLADAELSKLGWETNDATMLLRHEAAKANFNLLVDRKWRVLTDRHDLTVMRLVENGELVAQCNVSVLPDLPAGKQVSLEELQTDIKQSLDANFGQFLEAGQSVTEDGLRVLRVVAEGQSSDLPIRWIYYLISNDRGRRAAFVFTLESKLTENFGAADRTLTSTFQFSERSTPATADKSPQLAAPVIEPETASKKTDSSSR